MLEDLFLFASEDELEEDDDDGSMLKIHQMEYL
jgi:hypothetical protein